MISTGLTLAPSLIDLLQCGQVAGDVTVFVTARSDVRLIIPHIRRTSVESMDVGMAHYGTILRVAAAPFAVIVASILLETTPESARWALLICSMGFIGVTLRLRKLDAGR